jgi:hypothetical protein
MGAKVPSRATWLYTIYYIHSCHIPVNAIVVTEHISSAGCFVALRNDNVYYRQCSGTVPCTPAACLLGCRVSDQEYDWGIGVAGALVSPQSGQFAVLDLG